jgi:hypothetical protein
MPEGVHCALCRSRATAIDQSEADNLFASLVALDPVRAFADAFMIRKRDDER